MAEYRPDCLACCESRLHAFHDRRDTYHPLIELGFVAPDTCRDCGGAHIGADCVETAFHADWRMDRWMEAVLGARLRFHAEASKVMGPTAYWSGVYRRWAQLYREGKDFTFHRGEAWAPDPEAPMA